MYIHIYHPVSLTHKASAYSLLEEKAVHLVFFLRGSGWKSFLYTLLFRKWHLWPQHDPRSQSEGTKGYVLARVIWPLLSLTFLVPFVLRIGVVYPWRQWHVQFFQHGEVSTLSSGLQITYALSSLNRYEINLLINSGFHFALSPIKA